MGDWATVRYDESWEEKLDPEIIPLCDALNAAGFVTTSSCCGHGYAWPYVWFEHSADTRIESLARFILATEIADFRQDFSLWQKEVRLDGYAWLLEIHLNDVHRDTPTDIGLKSAKRALGRVTALVNEWSEVERMERVITTGRPG